LVIIYQSDYNVKVAIRQSRVQWVRIFTINIGTLIINNNRAMRKKDIQMLNNISLIESRQALLLERPSFTQKQFLHQFAHRYLVSREIAHRNVEEATKYLAGTYNRRSLMIHYICLCLENEAELGTELFPLLRILSSWARYYPPVESLNPLRLQAVVSQQSDDMSSFGHE